MAKSTRTRSGGGGNRSRGNNIETGQLGLDSPGLAGPDVQTVGGPVGGTPGGGLKIGTGYVTEKDDGALSFQHRLRVALPNRARTTAESPRHMALMQIGDEGRAKLADYLRVRLAAGAMTRANRMPRYQAIDRLISTWQIYGAEDTKRLQLEDATGQQAALRENLPILAAHLEDLVAFYADTLSPVGSPVVSSSGEKGFQEIIKRITQDIIARNYNVEVAASCRALLKYNIGGLHVEWDEGSTTKQSLSSTQSKGNKATALDPYNVLWDTHTADPESIPTEAEWAAVITRTNRVTLMRRSTAGRWFGVDRIVTQEMTTAASMTIDQKVLRLYQDTSATIPTSDGANGRHGSGNQTTNWGELGLSIPSDYTNVDNLGSGYEHTTMYAWICPHIHGLLLPAEIEEMVAAEIEPTAFLELWRFELINNEHIVLAEPKAPRDRSIKGESAVIPMFMAYLTQDQLRSAQRSPMELVAGFQRLASAMYATGVDSLRKGLAGTTVIDSAMFNVSDFNGNGIAKTVASKTPGRDVRAGYAVVNDTGGAGEAMGQVSNVMNLKNALFPNQALPSQVAGIDRAVTNQVASVVHGAQRSLRLSLRLVDANIYGPSRLEFVRNLQRYESMTTPEVSDEVVAKELGSGIESLESERVTDAIWKVLMAVIQNQEAMQAFDVPKMLAYLGEVLRVKVDMSTFARNRESVDVVNAPGSDSPPAQVAPPSQAAAQTQQPPQGGQ